jgi:hypothetical protein
MRIVRGCSAFGYGLVVVVVLVVMGCGTRSEDDVLVVHSADSALPGETLRDRVSYGVPGDDLDRSQALSGEAKYGQPNLSPGGSTSR